MMLGVSKQAVWLRIGQDNQRGPEGLRRSGRAGRRWSLLELKEEQWVLERWTQRAQGGEVITAGQLLPEVKKAIGQKVSLAYVYKLFKRHGWRKTGPRPRHVRARREAQEAFKKNSLDAWTRALVSTGLLCATASSVFGQKQPSMWSRADRCRATSRARAGRSWARTG